MIKQEKNWFIGYDIKTFQFLQYPKVGDQAYAVAMSFIEQQGPQTDVTVSISPWISAVAEANKDILQLLYNFFYVEQKLNQKPLVKNVFLKIYTVLQVQFQYAQYFFVSSQEFRLNRILASCLRLNRFLEAIFSSIDSIKKHLDNTLIENFQEVFLYMQQKIKQTLKKTQSKGDHELNIIMLDMLSLILRYLGDPTMHKILDVQKQKRIQYNIEKSNQIYQQFKRSKDRERSQFEKNRYFSTKTEVQQDPNKQEISSSRQNSVNL